MNQIIGFEVDRDEERHEWALKLRYVKSEAPDVLQVKYIRYKDLMSLFSFIVTFTGEDDDGKT